MIASRPFYTYFKHCVKWLLANNRRELSKFDFIIWYGPNNLEKRKDDKAQNMSILIRKWNSRSLGVSLESSTQLDILKYSYPKMACCVDNDANCLWVRFALNSQVAINCISNGRTVRALRTKRNISSKALTTSICNIGRCSASTITILHSESFQLFRGTHCWVHFVVQLIYV